MIHFKMIIDRQSCKRCTAVVCSSAGWRDVEGRAPRQKGQKEVLDQLLGHIKEAHRHCVCHGINNFLIDSQFMLGLRTEQ